MNDKIILLKFTGGSNLYGLNGHDSDVDNRGIFMHTDPAYIIGTKRHDEDRRQNDVEDTVYKELSHWATLVRKSNSEALEMLFANDELLDYVHPYFRKFQLVRYDLVDSLKLFNCLRGYMQGEARLVRGERKGQIGGKRYIELQKYGFSPKNFCNYMRLARVGIEFFNTEQYIVNWENHEYIKTLREIKFSPENFSIDDVENMMAEADVQIVEAYENRSTTFTFNEDLINELLVDVYLKILNKSS